MRLITKRTLMTIFLLGLFFVNTGYTQMTKSSPQFNQYRLEKLSTFLNKICTVHLLDGKQLIGQITRLESQHVVLTGGSGPFFSGQKRLPIYGIQRIASGKQEQIFVVKNSKNYQSEKNTFNNNSTIKLEELLAILEAEEIPMLAQPDKIEKPLNPVPQKMKKLTKKNNEFEIIDLINSQATNEDE